jgi:hypothetical protein
MPEILAMSIKLRLFLLFAFTAVCEFVFVLMYPGQFSPNLRSPHWLIAGATFFGAAVGPFIVGGAIPFLYWAIRRFRRESAGSVMIVWALLIGLFVYFQYYGYAHP